MSALSFWQWILDSLKNGKPAALLVVIAHSKGSPGKRGFKLALNIDGTSIGTIGGGIMEVNLSRLALRAIRDKNPKIKIIPQYHHKKAERWQSGMICSGYQELLLCLLEIEEIHIIEGVVENIKRNKAAYIAFTQNGIQLQEMGLSLKAGSCLYQETLGYENILCIVGGGHIGSALAKLAWDLGFYVHVIDFRPNLSTLIDQRFIHQVSLIPFTELHKILKYSLQNTYAVIVSTSAASDEIALRELIDLPLAYIGLMGSPTKISHIFNNLEGLGVNPSALKRVFTPIGIDIQSETAQEIAVSIAAELIREKNLRKKIFKQHLSCDQDLRISNNF